MDFEVLRCSLKDKAKKKPSPFQYAMGFLRREKGQDPFALQATPPTAGHCLLTTLCERSSIAVIFHFVNEVMIIHHQQ